MTWCPKIWKLVFVVLCFPEEIPAWLLECYSGSRNDSLKVSPENVTNLIGSDYLKLNLTTAVYTFGYWGKSSGPVTEKVLSAFFVYNQTNVCLLNWEDEANAGIIGLSYFYVVQTMNEIAKELAQALMTLQSRGLNLASVWLVGFSLGAHLFGATGREVLDSSSKIGRITGLDPAYFGYDGITAVQTPLDKTCAAFVDILHTTNIKYGMVTTTGHVDVLINRGYYLENGRQLGCPSGIFVPFTNDDLCSHNRSPEYLVQSLQTPRDMVASSASSYSRWVEANGDTSHSTVIYVGPLTNKSATGTFYMSTNAESPYGKGETD